ncbi:MAG: tetratricopeptide repeat protein, partial [Chloroflexi bacterium]|nr:tetratricopeptide repeat protein [Chloroflexota bacterium]
MRQARNRIRWRWLWLWLGLALACNMPLPGRPDHPPASPTERADRGPTSTPAPTPVPTPSPTPTWPPALQQGWRWLFYGDWDAAFAAFQQAYQQADSPEARAQALLGQARARANAGDVAAALNLLREVLAQYPMTRAAQQAYFHLAWMYFRLERYIESAQAFDAYL